MTLLSRPDYDRLLIGSPLRNRRVCQVICAALFTVVVFAALVHLLLLLGARPDVAGVFLRALVLSGLLSIVPVAILWYLDRRERETPWLFAAAFLWGGVIATGLSLPFNTAVFWHIDVWLMRHPALLELLGPDAAQMLAAPLSAPIVEEIAKALGLLALFWLLHAEFDNMRDGIVYGALIGVGFNWFEAAAYVAQGYAEYGTPPYALQFGARYALFGLGGHVLFTGIFGAALGFAMQTRHAWLRIVVPILGLLLAMLAHALNNLLPLLVAISGAAAGDPGPEYEGLPDVGFLEVALSTTLLNLTLFMPFVAIVVLAVWRSGVWERRVISEELADEVGRSVSPAEYDEIVRDRAFRTRRIDALHPRTSAALINAQHELAFRKRRVRDAGLDPDADPLVAGWRNEIRLLRGVA
jgi:RsiW-degrading membrane proteinase PrsW (M82 family)